MSSVFKTYRDFSFFLFAILFCAGASADAHHEEDKSFSVTEVVSNLYMLQGLGGNIAVMTGEDGLVIIDDDYKKMSAALKKALQQFGGEEKLAYIINTHWHGDHTEGNIALGHNAPIVAHDNVRVRLSEKNEIALFNMKSDPYPEHALPDITYSETLTLHINDDAISLIHYPSSHSDGDSAIIFKQANVLHTGDLFFNGFFPFVDTANGGNVKKLARSIEHLLGLLPDDVVIIPGHGPLADKNDLEEHLAMLEGSIEEVTTMKNQGLSLAEIQEKGLSNRWERWSKGMMPEKTWIQLVFESL